MRQDLIDIRRRMGMTQVDMSVKAGVSLSVIAQIETGRRKTFSPRIARKLAAGYGISIEQINQSPVPSAA